MLVSVSYHRNSLLLNAIDIARSKLKGTTCWKQWEISAKTTCQQRHAGAILHYFFMIDSIASTAAEKRVTIFIVDDEPMLLELAAAVLEPLGYDVRTFSNPEVAIAEFPKVKPAVIVTDFAMGKISGLDLIRECKGQMPLQKIMLLSGTVDEQVFHGSATKPDAFLAKPYRIADLVESVQRLASR